MSLQVIRDPMLGRLCVPCDGVVGLKRRKSDGHIPQLRTRMVFRQCDCTCAFAVNWVE